jgi:hypothetical protein
VILRGFRDSLPKQSCKNICDLFKSCVVTYVENGRGTVRVITPDHCVAVRKGLKLDVTLVSLCHACFFLSFFLSLREGLSLDVRLVSVTAFHFVDKAEVVVL